jgi:excisionase family DNA binding protein
VKEQTVISEDTLQTARQTARELRQRGEHERATAIEALVDAAREDALPSLDLLTSTQAGELLGVSGQTVKNWVHQRHLSGYRVGGRIMVPAEAVKEYVRRARQSLELEVIPDEEAARLVEGGRGPR